jgi:hypothetical protein
MEGRGVGEVEAKIKGEFIHDNPVYGFYWWWWWSL